MMKRIFAALILLSFSDNRLWAGQGQPDKNYQKHSLKRIVIDAGHGGSDYGASGSKSHEKDITLAVALELQKAINDQMPDVDVYMTRTTDVFDRVTVKASKANAAKGDLFVSIHCNDAGRIRHTEIEGYKTVTRKRKGKKVTSKVPIYHSWTTPNPAKGTETYIWGVNKDDDKEKAVREGDNEVLDSLSAKELKNFDPNDPAQILAISLRTQQYAERSRNLAITVEDEFAKSGRISRGARQRNEKGIWVLQATNMPAILIEVGFLSNPEEEDYLMSKEGQEETANTIVRALKRYKYSLDNKLLSNKQQQK
ncbi:MAG: N-acetylmuramoyl-L-alanine amidase [Bacteroidota bacterium]|nr:N-acetylmuramoyl-L-alanine amidase [Bacteroidota bacterium]